MTCRATTSRTRSIHLKSLTRKRSELAVKVWVYMKQNDSRGGITTAKMDPEKQTEKARARHEKLRTEGLTCIDCHFAIAHTEPSGPGLKELFTTGPTKN